MTLAEISSSTVFERSSSQPKTIPRAVFLGIDMHIHDDLPRGRHR